MFTNNSPVPLSVRKKELDKDLLEWASKENKKIIVIIDELDRLFPKEIVEIFKLIKASISFPGVFFLVAIDRKVILDALRAVNITEPEDYLVKIFQQRFDININYQLRTLCTRILLPNVVDFQELSKNALIDSIYAIIFLEDSKLYIPPGANAYSSYGEARKGITNSYFNTNSSIAEHLSIPRTFINFTSYTINKWQSFYNNISDKEQLNERDSITAFLVFILNFICPETVENHILGNRDKSNRKELPLVFNIIRYELLNNLYPEIMTSSENDARIFITYDEGIIRKAIYHLKRYPDHDELFQNNK